MRQILFRSPRERAKLSKTLVGSMLWRNLRVYQIYGANTEVGKTVLTTVLCKATSKFYEAEKTHYLKPVSTGPLEDADERC